MTQRDLNMSLPFLFSGSSFFLYRTKLPADENVIVNVKNNVQSFGYTLTQLDLILDLVIITNTIKRIHNRPITIVLVELSMFKHAYTIYDFSNLRGKQIAA